MLTQEIARKLDMPPETLEKASLQTYLEARRREIEAQLFLLEKSMVSKPFKNLMPPSKRGESASARVSRISSPSITWRRNERRYWKP
jgi:hypothetical protein